MKRIILFLEKVLILVCYGINFLNFKLERVKYKRFPHTRGILRIRTTNKGSLSFGKKVVINSSSTWIRAGVGTPTSFWTINNGSIVIGNNVGMSNACICSENKVEIEDYVLIGAGTIIYDTDFHPCSYERRCLGDGWGAKTAPVRICEGSFIGARSIILKGVTVGRHSIVGAGSVVACSIPEGEIWGGNPARFIKKVK